MVSAHPRKLFLSVAPQGSVLGRLLFSIYFNGLPNNLIPIFKIFADDTSLFSKVFARDRSQRDLNNDLSIISEWTFQWKMQFNPDLNKQANEVYFPRKPNSDNYITTKLNDGPAQLCNSQKNLGVILVKHLHFHNQFEKKI